MMVFAVGGQMRRGIGRVVMEEVPTVAALGRAKV